MSLNKFLGILMHVFSISLKRKTSRIAVKIWVCMPPLCRKLLLKNSCVWNASFS